MDLITVYTRGTARFEEPSEIYTFLHSPSSKIELYVDFDSLLIRFPFLLDASQNSSFEIIVFMNDKNGDRL